MAIPFRKKFVAWVQTEAEGVLSDVLIFQENPGSRAYKLVAYKKKCNANSIGSGQANGPIHNRRVDLMHFVPIALLPHSHSIVLLRTNWRISKASLRDKAVRMKEVEVRGR